METVVLLAKGEINSKKVRVEFSLEGMDMSGFQKGVTYEPVSYTHFTIPYADLFKAYCFDREFKKLIDSGQFIFADRHLEMCIRDRP